MGIIGTKSSYLLLLAVSVGSCKTVNKKSESGTAEPSTMSEQSSPETGSLSLTAPSNPKSSTSTPRAYLAPLGMDKKIVGPLAPRLLMKPSPTEVPENSVVESSSKANTAQSLPQNNPVCKNFDLGDIAPLVCVPIPKPSHTDIINPTLAIALGKALFWDVQAGSDGKTSCATCHFLAGADPRRKNILNPGPDGIFASGNIKAAGQVLPNVFITNDDRAGSPGVAHRVFQSITTNATNAVDQCTPVNDPAFGTLAQVTGRNTPSSVGAVYYRQLFWDGRAHHTFNGNDPFGTTANAADPSLLCDNCGLASQAVGPANNEVEMSCTGRPFHGPNSLATKLLPRTPLQFQEISATDSVLKNYANSRAPRRGMICDRRTNRFCSYQELVDRAFAPEITGTKARLYFARIWGQAIQAYLATLNPTQTPLDKYLEGNNLAMTDSQKKGFSIFKGKGDCTECHSGPELSDATHSYFATEGAIGEEGNDTGFHNIGVRPTEEDLGRAGPGPNGVPFAENDSLNNRGAFKTPMLRNVKMTAPYFHNGGAATLEEVVNFYARGGDFKNSEIDSHMKTISLDAEERKALVDFLRNALTDPRVELQRAPFDHPSLPFPSGITLQAVGESGGAVSYVDASGKRVPLP